MAEDINIQWFPGHMAKAQRMIEENLRAVDVVCEIIDARIPESSRNPDVGRLTAGKPRLIILNRIDQADSQITKLWRLSFQKQGFAVLETDCKSGKGISGFPDAVRGVLGDLLKKRAESGQSGRMIRAMVLGIPNVGKSAFTNRVAKRKAAKVSDKPGVTRGKQWIVVGDGIELLDTPGILWPKFDNKQTGEVLAYTGAIRDEILDREALAGNLLLRLRELYPESIKSRYKFEPEEFETGYELLEAAAKKRGFLVSGGEYDLERMAAVLLDEFRAGTLGRISLERPVPEGE